MGMFWFQLDLSHEEKELVYRFNSSRLSIFREGINCLTKIQRCADMTDKSISVGKKGDMWRDKWVTAASAKVEGSANDQNVIINGIGFPCLYQPWPV